MRKFGIDVSSHKGDIDWKSVKNDGVEFAIIRAGYGREISQKDDCFESNYTKCRENGIPCGCYWYSYATTVEDAKREAETCLEVIKGKKFEYPIYFDIEEQRQAVLGRNTVSEIVKTFCDILENNGYWVGIYSYKSFLESYLTDDIRERYAIWVAHTGVEKTTYSNQHGIWQYSHIGKINGISGDVDCNYCYLDYPQMIAEANLNNHSNVPTYTKYNVKKGDTLWDIAEKFLGSGTEYNKIKKLNNLKSDTIFINQVIKIPKK